MHVQLVIMHHSKITDNIDYVIIVYAVYIIYGKKKKKKKKKNRKKKINKINSSEMLAVRARARTKTTTNKYTKLATIRKGNRYKRTLVLSHITTVQFHCFE